MLQYTFAVHLEQCIWKRTMCCIIKISQHFSSKLNTIFPCLSSRLEAVWSRLPVYTPHVGCQTLRRAASEMINAMKSPFTSLNKSRTLISSLWWDADHRAWHSRGPKRAVILQQRDPSAPTLTDKRGRARTDEKKEEEEKTGRVWQRKLNGGGWDWVDARHNEKLQKRVWGLNSARQGATVAERRWKTKITTRSKMQWRQVLEEGRKKCLKQRIKKSAGRSESDRQWEKEEKGRRAGPLEK